MKIFKKLLKIVLSLFGILLLTALILIWIDSRGTGYLKVEKEGAFANNSYLVQNVNVIPMNADTVLTGKTVYIKEGVIENISDKFTVEGVEIIKGDGKFLTPGLIDMHVHVWDEYELGLYLSNGVTAVRNLWGLPMHLRMKEAVNNAEIIAPLFFTTGPKLTGPEYIGDDNLQLRSAEEAKARVIFYKKRGYDFIKTYYGLTPEIFDAVVEQAAASQMDIIAHPSQKVSYNYHFKPQIRSVEHAEDIIQQPLNYVLDTIKLKEVVSDFSASGTTKFCPTLTVYNNIYQILTNDKILDSENLQYMNPLIRKVDSQAQFDRWQDSKRTDRAIVGSIKAQHEFHLKIIREMHEAGVPIICGTDAGIGVTVPGFSIHRELGFYKEAGLTNYEVLKTATYNASGTHAVMENMGSIEKGKIANLLLLNNNPLEDLSALKRPELVFVNGRKINRKQLNSFEEKAKNRKNLVVSGFRYAENLIREK
ncbi:amidohydrolase family protein [Salinimicrobium sp. CDJ15-91]|uniref:Amidohydrolase family protein n=2 Tax=Salinimicrobium oceani TaxID=2722702 RepID=A0ABX1CTU6_9FLAO|nr:amidohydrolase family protein [Salinimicrobium oceani]